jgi:hypothetical protein
MTRNIRWDKSVKENTLYLVEALLRHAYDEFEDEELKTLVNVEWVKENKLRVTGKKVKQVSGKRSRTDEVGTRKEYLLELVTKAGKILKIPKLKNEASTSLQNRELDEIQTALDCLKELGVREDEKSAKNHGYWKFTLTLEHHTKREENLELVKQKWEEHSIRTKKATPSNLVSKPSVSLSAEVLAALNDHKEICQQRDVPFYTASLFLALLKIDGITQRLLEELERGIVPKLCEALNTYINKELPSYKERFSNFEWEELEQISQSKIFAIKDGYNEVKEKHLLLGFLNTESKTCERLKAKLGKENFDSLIKMAKAASAESQHRSSTPGTPF